jgi:predicted restriction endonuclease
MVHCTLGKHDTTTHQKKIKELDKKIITNEKKIKTLRNKVASCDPHEYGVDQKQELQQRDMINLTNINEHYNDLIRKIMLCESLGNNI